MKLTEFIDYTAPIPNSPDPKGRYLECYQTNILDKLYGLDKIDYLSKYGMVKPLQLLLEEVNFEPDFEEEEEIFYQKQQSIHLALRRLYPESVGRCSCYHLVKYHECGSRVSKVGLYCGDKHRCPVCARARASNQGIDWAERLKGTGAYEIQMVTLTIPNWLSLEICDMYEGDKKKIRELMLLRAKQFMDAMFPDVVGYMAVCHVWHSREPLTLPHLHVHILYPCIKWNKDKTGLVKFRAYLHDQELFEKRLRECQNEWALINGEASIIPFTIHFAYTLAKNERKLQHMCKYVVRLPILDINRWMLRESPKDLSDEQLGMLEWLTEKVGGSRIRAYRGLSHSKINATLILCESSLVEVKAKAKKLKADMRRAFCPHCKKEIPSHFWKTAEIFYSEKPPPFQVLRLRHWTMYEEVAG